MFLEASFQILCTTSPVIPFYVSVLLIVRLLFIPAPQSEENSDQILCTCQAILKLLPQTFHPTLAPSSVKNLLKN